MRICLGKEVPELKSAITLSVYTKAPLKWVLIDTETLEIYKGTNNQEIRQQWEKIISNDEIEVIQNVFKIKK
jgi:hypothetical protein